MIKHHNRGFTLIELLIVVAIIAILAAIAIPNFLLAQVRAKTARAKGELKTLATALESYYVDYTCYPDDLNGGYPWFIPDVISTPIAYISSGKLLDLFRPPNVTGGYAWNFMDRYRYNNYDIEVACLIATSSEAHWSKKGAYPGWPGYNTYAFKGRWQYGKYRLDSCGPDRYAGPYYTTSGYWANKGIPQYYDWQMNDCVYDPTNGTMSWGDIIRSQKQAEHKTEYSNLNTMGSE